MCLPWFLFRVSNRSGLPMQPDWIKLWPDYIKNLSVWHKNCVAAAEKPRTEIDAYMKKRNEMREHAEKMVEYYSRNKQMTYQMLLLKE